MHHGSRFTNKNIQYPHQISYSISDDPIFEASVRLAGKEKVVISTSLGTFFALDDLFTRLACNRDFYSQSVDARLWDGCDCLWLYPVGGLFPAKRYYDYRTQKIIPSTTIGQEGTYLSAFHGGIPMEQQRIVLAMFMTEIALLWILIHEESHYTLGHLMYLQDELNLSSEKLCLNEEDNIAELFGSQDLSKVLEWQADRDATRAVIDIFFNKDFVLLLPSYCKQFETTWLLRAILIAVGTVSLIFQKAQTLYGTADSYPSPRTRILGAFFEVFNKIRDPRGMFKDQGLELAPEIDDDAWERVVFEVLYDLGIVSELINQESELQEWVPQGSPVIKTTHDLELLDSPEEILILTSMIVQAPFLSYMFKDENWSNLNDEIRIAIPQSYRNLFIKWFSEFELIVKSHDGGIWSALQAFRVKGVEL